ncbi:MAG TPA: SAM-dependent methyltransferase [Erythrobacter sp.]|nr:SAM-dependent methyltransferase [Erythrobacter sp.]HCJ80917.1 SAM-dependent methyltransferase [Erythrobacter sp.]
MKRHAPATARNSQPLAEVLARELPASGTVLEIASGSGEHAVFMARRFPALDWQPSDRDAEALASVDAWAAEARLANLRPAIALDAAAPDWPIVSADALLCVNMVHISPWDAAVGLFAGAGRVLGSGAPLVLYGPFVEPDVETAASNHAFDQSLRQRDPAWGLRSTADLDRLAAGHGMTRTARCAMPANNLVLVYRRD